MFSDLNLYFVHFTKLIKSYKKNKYVCRYQREAENRRADNAMAKRKTKRYTNNGSQKIHIKLKIEQYETTKPGGNAGAPEELALPVLLVTYIIPVDKW